MTNTPNQNPHHRRHDNHPDHNEHPDHGNHPVHGNRPVHGERPARGAAREPDDVEQVRLARPQDLVAAVPYLLRFHPDPGNLVVVAFHAGRIQVTIRLDGGHRRPSDIAGVWGRLRQPLADADADLLIIVGYLPADREDLLDAFAAAAPVPVREVLRVDQGRWWCLTCTGGPACCPPGAPVEAPTTVIAPLLAVSGAPAANRAALAAVLAPGPVEDVDAVAARLPLSPVPAGRVLFRAVADAHADATDGSVSLSPDRAAVLLHALSDLRIRDLACAWYDDAAWWLWTALIRLAPAGHVAPVATLIATTAYQRGDTATARLAAERALGADPGYQLGQLTMGLLEAQIDPAHIRDGFTHALDEAAASAAYLELLPADVPGATPRQLVLGDPGNPVRGKDTDTQAGGGNNE